MKHNKKRNTAFLYETLVKELTRIVIAKENNKKDIVVSILKEHFSKGKVLHNELSCYKAITECKNLKRNIAEKILSEAKTHYNSLSKDDIFKEQSKVINKINKNISPSLFSNFVPEYKQIATIAQIFNSSLPIKDKVLLEETILENMCKDIEEKEKMVPVDNLVYKTFVKKFNEKYSDSLLREQKELLTNYLVSYSDNGLSLKVFLNEEIQRVKDSINECLELESIKNDKSMVKKTNLVLEKLEEFKKKEFDKKMLGEFLKIQYFVNEATIND